jgi:protein-arginine kinase activator protein McsA
MFMEPVSPYSFMSNLKQMLNEQHELLRNQKQSLLKNEEWETAVVYRDIERKLKQAIAIFEVQAIHANHSTL